MSSGQRPDPPSRDVPAGQSDGCYQLDEPATGLIGCLSLPLLVATVIVALVACAGVPIPSTKPTDTPPAAASPTASPLSTPASPAAPSSPTPTPLSTPGPSPSGLIEQPPSEPIWDAPRTMPWNGWADGLASNGASTAIAVYEKHFDDGFSSRLLVRRSADAGSSWGFERVFARHGDMGDVAALDQSVDLVWRDGGGDLRYAVSGDEGRSFASSTLLTEEGNASVWFPRVARGPGGLVAVAWAEQWPPPLFPERISIRVSSDGGQTFGPTYSLPTAEPEGMVVGVGEGVVYVSYQDSATRVRIRRSLDAGVTWSAAGGSGEAGWWPSSMTADGASAYIAFGVDRDGRYTTVVQRTTDRGTSWSLPRSLAPDSWSVGAVRLDLSDSVLRAVFVRAMEACGDEGGPMYYTQSVDGERWSEPQRVSSKGDCTVLPTDIAVGGGKILVLYQAAHSWAGRFHVELRSATP